MPNLQEITDAIDDRLVELRQQIASLEAARRALTGIQQSRPGGRAETRPAAATRTPRKARRSRTTAPRRPAASASASASAPPASDRAIDQAEVTPPAKPVRRRRSQAPAAAGPAPSSKPARSAAATAPKARATKSSSRNRRRELEPGQIEGLLQESEDGLSLVALARRVGVSEAKVSDRLRSLERSGEVRRSGPRRTSLWRRVTDEERIAERAAELARVSQSRT
jgi:DNA-binding MarR family transcriptional regulator